MVTPLVGEASWMEILSGVPSWLPAAKQTLVIAPHPDDETLCAGGLIQHQRARGLDVQIIAVTDGGAAYADAPADLTAIRQFEQEQASAILGVEPRGIVRLRFPDSRVADHETDLAAALSEHITPGSLVLAPWPLDSHPDHEACGRAIQRAAQTAELELVFYLFWTWHQKPLDALNGQPLRRFDLTPQQLSVKHAALECHRTQLQWDSSAPVLPFDILAPARRSFETFIVHE